LKIQRLKSISPPVSIQRLFAILIAAAMLFAPFALQSGSAMAAMPADHRVHIESKGHCQEQPHTGTDSQSSEMACCPAMCAGIAVEPLAPFAPVAFARPAERPADIQFGHGFLAKLPTPPPRPA
jgi:hypothetical protein